ncbi:hypothetical protein BX616_009783 [Lobosporangium transversale]|nr:hypothetical protein BX616_009783 [Lobosporangium transversale]
MANKTLPSILTEGQQYLVIEQALIRAGYDHDANIENRPKTTHGSFIFPMLNASISTPGGGFYGGDNDNHKGADRYSIEGNGSIFSKENRTSGVAIGASSMNGSVTCHNINGGLQLYSPISAGSFTHKIYANTARSSTSSMLSIGRQKSEPPVSILPHYNSPYEAMFFNQPDTMHFIGKDLRIGTICISMRPSQDAMRFLVRTVLKFTCVDVLDSYRATAEFEKCQSLYTKKNEILPMLHVALQQCFESIPEVEVKRHQVVQHQSATDHSVFVLDDSGWLQSPRYIANLVHGLEEVRQEGFAFVLKNLEAQMRPAAVSLDIVIPNKDESLTADDQEQFWAFFNGLGEHIEAETYLPNVSKHTFILPSMIAGDKSEGQRLSALAELIETETSYNKRMNDLISVIKQGAYCVYKARHIRLEARYALTALSPPLGKYEIRMIFSNIEQIVAASTEFLKDLNGYQNHKTNEDKSLGEICRKNLQNMQCYKHYLMRYKRAQEIHLALSKKSQAYRAFQERCIHTTGIQTLSNLLVEPTQRIVKYPLLFKDLQILTKENYYDIALQRLIAILSGTNKDSEDVDGLREAAHIASEIAHMEKAKPEQRAEMLFNLRSIIENCPDSIVNQNRSIISYMDGFETNLLTGERGRPITLILFSDKIMIVRRPSTSSGEALFHLKEDEEQRKQKEREEKEREKKSKRDGRNDTDGCNNGGGIHGGSVVSIPGLQLLRKDWKFMGWMDILRVKVAVVEQTDPEGLFCITTRNYAENMHVLLVITRGIMPEGLDKRDTFISKFYETLSLAKATFTAQKAESTSRLHVGELELYCNVFTESQYRDFKFKGDVALFYTCLSHYPADVAPFTTLPAFVGMIQTAAYSSSSTQPETAVGPRTCGFRAILKSKANLNGAGDVFSVAKETSHFLDMDTFQTHIAELVANLQWTVYSFSPYQSAQLHFSRVYMDTDYLFKAAGASSKSTSLRSKSLKKIRDSASAVAAWPSSPSSLGQQHRYSGSFSPLASPHDTHSIPSSPSSYNLSSALGRSNSIVGIRNSSHAIGNEPSQQEQHDNQKHDSPVSMNKRFSMPTIMKKYPSDSNKNYDNTDRGSGSPHPQRQGRPLHHQSQSFAENTIKNSVSVISLLLPGSGRKKGLISSMSFKNGGDNKGEAKEKTKFLETL